MAPALTPHPRRGSHRCMETTIPARLLSARQREFLAALLRALVPQTRDLPPERQAMFFAIIETTLAARPRQTVRLLRIYLAFLRWYSLALGLLVVGLIGVLTQSAADSLLN